MLFLIEKSEQMLSTIVTNIMAYEQLEKTTSAKIRVNLQEEPIAQRLIKLISCVVMVQCEKFRGKSN